VKVGFSPLDTELKLTKHAWSEGTIAEALELGVEIASYERAAKSYSRLSGVALSKSSLQRLVAEYGGALVQEQAAEAKAVVAVPKRNEEVVWRQEPEPDSEVMAVSADGVMLNIRDEGWKEVKAVSVSAVTQTVDEQSGERKLALQQHSYRAGLWDATTFAQHYWAETLRRGVNRAKYIACVNDGAAWIWAIVFMCFARCVEILDWWHVVQRLWTIADAHFSDPALAAAWVSQRKADLAQSHLRTLFQQIRLLYPRGQPLPDPVRQAIAYLFHNRHRLDYAAYRQLGLPIGSGTIESACKSVVQARMTQAGMRWSRNGAQAMLALRCLLLSQRWDNLPSHPP
jgi:hypothetical protein